MLQLLICLSILVASSSALPVEVNDGRIGNEAYNDYEDQNEKLYDSENDDLADKLAKLYDSEIEKLYDSENDEQLKEMLDSENDDNDEKLWDSENDDNDEQLLDSEKLWTLKMMTMMRNCGILKMM